MITREDEIDVLNELIQVSKDAEQGYRTAAENVTNSELETVFRGYAKQRAGFVQELEAEFERLGGRDSDSGTLSGALHRGWMDLKSALSGGDPRGMVAACESGEERAEAAYARAATTGISGKGRSLLEKQWQQVKEAHKRMHRLKDEMEDGTRFPKNE